MKKQVKMYRIVNDYDGYDYDDVCRYTLQCLNCKDFFNSDKIPKFCQECGMPFEKEFTKKNRRWDKPRKEIQLSSKLEIWYEARNASGWSGSKFEDNKKSSKYRLYKQWISGSYLFDDGNSVKTLREIQYYKERLRLLSRMVSLVRVDPANPPKDPSSSTVRLDNRVVLKEWKGFDRPEDYYAKFEKGGCSG